MCTRQHLLAELPAEVDQRARAPGLRASMIGSTTAVGASDLVDHDPTSPKLANPTPENAADPSSETGDSAPSEVSDLLGHFEEVGPIQSGPSRNGFMRSRSPESEDGAKRAAELEKLRTPQSPKESQPFVGFFRRGT